MIWKFDMINMDDFAPISNIIPAIDISINGDDFDRLEGSSDISETRLGRYEAIIDQDDWDVDEGDMVVLRAKSPGALMVDEIIYI